MPEDDGVTLAVIALYFGVSTTKIRKTRNDLHLQKKLNKVMYDESEFKRLFLQGITYPEMGKILGMSRCSVIDIKRRLGLPNRNSVKVKND